MRVDKCQWCKRVLAADGRRRCFCSRDCAVKDHNRRASQARLKGKLEKLEAAGCLDLKCRQCGRDFRPNWAKGGPPPVYCSERCRMVYWSRTRGAEYKKAVG